MTKQESIEGLEVGYDIPAAIGMARGDIQTPCLILDLDALERNIKKMGDYAKAHGMRHRVHGKMHKSVDVAKLQTAPRRRGRRLLPEGQRGRGVRARRHQGHPGLQPGPRPGEDRPARAHTEAWRPHIVCIDDIANVADLSAAAQKHGTTLGCFVEIDCGAGRCGVTTTADVVEIAKAIAAAPGLSFTGIQAYQGAMQHLDKYEDRKAKLDAAIAQVKDAVEALKAAGLAPELVSGGGTGSATISRATSGVYNELQCGSYAFMDADYGRILDKRRQAHRPGRMGECAVHPDLRDEPRQADKAICDAGLKAQSVDSRPARHLRPQRREIRQVLRRARRDRGPGRRPEGRRQAAPGARPLRPDLQRARLVCRRAQRQGRVPVADLGPRQGLLTPTPAPGPKPGRTPRLSYGLETWRAVVFPPTGGKTQQRRQRAHLRAPCRGNGRVPHPQPAPRRNARDVAAPAARRRGLDALVRRSPDKERDMIIVPEAACPSLLSLDEAFAPVEQVFAAMARGDAANFPVVREALGEPEEALYGFKGGYDREGRTLGLKAGGYWPHNLERRQIGNHQSTVFLFDPDTGRPTAMVGGNYLTAARTAASSAVSIKHLARKDAKVLGMIGAGHQAAFQLRAALRQRPFERVIGWNLHPEMLPRLAEVATEAGLPFEAVDLDRLGAEADVIVTITSSFAPILKAAQVKPGTHLACMGTDTKGKQEVEAALLARATVFTDEVAQSVDHRRGPARRCRGPHRRDRHHPDRRRHQRRPSGPHLPARDHPLRRHRRRPPGPRRRRQGRGARQGGGQGDRDRGLTAAPRSRRIAAPRRSG